MFKRRVAAAYPRSRRSGLPSQRHGVPCPQCLCWPHGAGVRSAPAAGCNSDLGPRRRTRHDVAIHVRSLSVA
eukprot:2044243-Pyramimonas_sp.AAC.1